jgi:hypothetical protein
MVFVTHIVEGMLILGDQQQVTSSFLEEHMFFGEQEVSYNSPFFYGNTIHGFYSSNERCSLAHKVFGIRKIQT